MDAALAGGAVRAVLVACALACAASACAANSDQIGVDEPFRIRDAQFVRGTLPGKPPAKVNATVMGAHAAGSGARITQLTSLNNVVYQGQGGKKFEGQGSTASRSVAIALAGVGSGYWVLPMGGVDPQTDNLTWTAVSDFDRGLRPGTRELRAVAIDEHGVAGQQAALTLCVAPEVPDNLHVCDGKRPLPKAVITLTWDANVDLDLQVRTPDGQIIDSKHPLTAEPDDMGMLPDDVGIIDRDSNAGCALDGIRAESLVYANVKPQGRYGIYANLFDACKQPAVRFHVAVYGLVTDDNGGERLKQWVARDGELLDLSANGGSARGLFVTEFVFH
jgi:hypothetical protein